MFRILDKGPAGLMRTFILGTWGGGGFRVHDMNSSHDVERLTTTSLGCRRCGVRAVVGGAVVGGGKGRVNNT